MLGYEIATLAAYLIAVIAIGLWTKRREATGDFLIANRSAGVVLTTASLSAVAGGLVLAGDTELGFEYGAGALWLVVGDSAGLALLGLVAGRIRRLADEHGFLTLTDYLFLRFGARTGYLGFVLQFVGFLFLLAAQFIVGGRLFATLASIEYPVAVIFMGAVTVTYVLLGGFKAVIRTDLLQFAVMFLVFVFLSRFTRCNCRRRPLRRAFRTAAARACQHCDRGDSGCAHEYDRYRSISTRLYGCERFCWAEARNDPGRDGPRHPSCYGRRRCAGDADRDLLAEHFGSVVYPLEFANGSLSGDPSVAVSPTDTRGRFREYSDRHLVGHAGVFVRMVGSGHRAAHCLDGIRRCNRSWYVSTSPRQTAAIADRSVCDLHAFWARLVIGKSSCANRSASGLGPSH